MPKLIIQILKDNCKLKGTYDTALAVSVMYGCVSLGDLSLAEAFPLPHVVIAEFYPTFSILGIEVFVHNYAIFN